MIFNSIRGMPVRRSLKTKFLLFTLLLTTFVLYIKFVTSNYDIQDDEDNFTNRKSTSEKLVSKLSDQNNLKISKYINEKHFLPKYDDIYEELISADIMKQEPGLGENGQSAVLMNTASKEIGDNQLKHIALNEELSEHISYNRTLQDARNPLCQSQKFDLDILPTTSVVIIFYNEPYSVLVRTVHSVLNTVDHRLLKEIILVDDSSTNIMLKEKLDYYIRSKLPRNLVKIVRLKNRLV